MAIPFISGFFRFFPWLFAGLVAMAPAIMPALIRVSLMTLGVGVVSYIGIQELIDYAVGRLEGQLQGIPSDIAEVVRYMGVFDAVAILLSAVNVRVAINLVGAAGGAVSRYRLATKLPPVFKDI